MRLHKYRTIQGLNPSLAIREPDTHALRPGGCLLGQLIVHGEGRWRSSLFLAAKFVPTGDQASAELVGCGLPSAKRELAPNLRQQRGQLGED